MQNIHKFVCTARNIQTKPPRTFENLREPYKTFQNLQPSRTLPPEPSGTFRDLPEPSGCFVCFFVFVVLVAFLALFFLGLRLRCRLQNIDVADVDEVRTHWHEHRLRGRACAICWQGFSVLFVPHPTGLGLLDFSLLPPSSPPSSSPPPPLLSLATTEPPGTSWVPVRLVKKK